ncbi:glutamate receptor 2.7 [Amborella trichopoda]|nr:glutamate receptor 2.7 [Amborella trichopoda]|eukprot:XP_006845539.2 glutamate receptor 2.7 [Amborella trichopoda]
MAGARMSFSHVTSHFVPLFLLLVHLPRAHSSTNQSTQVDVGIIMGLGSMVGKASQTSIKLAIEDFYSHHENSTTRLALHWIDSELHVFNAGMQALDLVKNKGVQAIIGPQTSTGAKFLANLGTKTKVPILSFSATSSFISSTRTPYFIRATLNDSTQAKPIASLFQAYNWRQAIAIYEDTEYGTGLIPFLTDAFQEIGSRIEDRTILSISASDEFIVKKLYKLKHMQTRVFVVHMNPQFASRLFRKALQLDMMSKEYAWIITDELASFLNCMDPLALASMQGVLGVKSYITESKALANLSARWKEIYKKEFPNEKAEEIPTISTVALRAYDAAWALALAIENSGQFRHPTHKKFTQNSPNFTVPRKSLSGPKLLRSILKTKFSGYSGHIQFIKGELQASAFQIVNIVEDGVKEIGFWTARNGLSRRLKHEKQNYSARSSDLGRVVWPGGSMVEPRGWVVSPKGVKLRIGVPRKKYGSGVAGFSREVFLAVINALPYSFAYKLVAFEKGEGANARTYDDLIYQVYLKNFDAVVGDVTIRANRSNYVDFTIPYLNSGVAMVVPVKKDDKTKDAWVFLKPLTWRLWVMSGLSFVLTGFVVWALEHRSNKDFRGTKTHQLGVVLSFSFSTMFFAHKETVASNLGRFVVTIWLFVVLILNSSYTASLTSMLTVQQLQPTVTNIDTLIKNGDYIGCQPRSFIRELLKRLHVNESKLKTYDNFDEYAEALSKGSQNGGISAYFEEVPYIKLFLSNYCDRFTMVGPTYRTAGFGFVFPKGSPLVSDVSKAILEVVEGNKMLTLNKLWLHNETSCRIMREEWDSKSSNGLSINNFKGLFLITGLASAMALLTVFVRFLNKHLKRQRNSLFWEGFLAKAHFNLQHSNEPTFKRREQRDGEVENKVESDTLTVVQGEVRNHMENKIPN